MTGRGKTKALIIVVTALVIAYDVMAYVSWGVDATISRIALGWSQAAPILPFSVGVLMGHLFWPQPSKRLKE